MKICDILTQELIVPKLTATDKESVLRELSSHISLHNHGFNADAQQIFDALIHRERLGSTGVGEAVAIPHAKIPGLASLVACFGRAPNGVSFDAIDEQPVKLIFVLLVPESSAGAHLKALARISRLLKDPAFREQLLSRGGQGDIYAAFLEEDAKY